MIFTKKRQNTKTPDEIPSQAQKISKKRESV
jgi:hypothetical protein